MEETKKKAKKWKSGKVVIMMFFLTVNGVEAIGQRGWSRWRISYISDVQVWKRPRRLLNECLEGVTLPFKVGPDDNYHG